MSIKELVVSLLVAFVLITQAAAEPLYGKLTGQVLATGRKLLLIDQTGHTLWEYKAGGCADVWMLDNGNVLFANGSIFEVNPKTNKIVFKYTPEMKKNGGAYSCQRLPNGNTVVGENSAGRITEVDPTGKVVFVLELPMTKPGEHHNLRMVRKLENGNYLTCHSGKAIVREYTPGGKVVFEVKVPGKIAFSAVRLDNGNTIVGHINGITEFKPDVSIAWSFKPDDLPEVSFGKICGIHVQPNNNIAMGIYGISKKDNGAEFLEITRQKKLVWRYKAPNAKGARMGVQVLDALGKPQQAKVLR